MHRRILVIGFLLSNLLLLPSSGHTAEPEILVMSYNIRYLNNRDGEDIWTHRKQAVCKTISKADVVGLQEVVAKQLDDIKEGTDGWQWYAVGRDDGKSGGEATPIGWRKDRFELLEKGTFWLSPTPEVVASKGWDAALPRIASWVRLKQKQNQKEFIFLNTHFDHRGQLARENSAKLILQWLADHAIDTPAVVAGDFNAMQNQKPIETILGNAPDGNEPILSNARDMSEVKDSGPDTTWNGFRELEAGRRIDFLFVNKLVDVRVFETQNPQTEAGRFASDHLPIVANVRLPQTHP